MQVNTVVTKIELCILELENDIRMVSEEETFSHSKDLETLVVADPNPVRLRCSPLDLVDLSLSSGIR